METSKNALLGAIVEAHIPDEHGTIQHILTAEITYGETTEKTLGRIGIDSFSRILTPAQRIQAQSGPDAIAYRTKQTTDSLPPLQ